ncbi:hypothetical protein ACKRZS_004438 [Fusarium odoratissimum]|uniref:Major facilitator superfamily (MFS) profile domain-containing protein n=1 Tax=Fusarium oxysporum f. sp. conglutinans TaxID=100902 RepID=A0A8H6LND8_FUSOX|nr:hypothetical protein HZS61_010386 [Fusarium oxysporum f. sp. conglutinans]
MDTGKASVQMDEGDTPAAGREQNLESWDFNNQTEEWRKDFDKKLLRKVDMRLMPTLVIMYLLNFLDRSNLAQARQGSLEEDLGMSGTDFNLATSIFFVGYLLMQLPSNLILTKLRPSLYLSASCAAILGDLEGAHGIAGWRWLFIIEGVAAIGFSFIAAVALPNYPHTTKWLTQEERAFAAWRLAQDISEVDAYGEKTIWDGVKLAVRDYRLYLFVLLQHVSLISQTFQYFFPTIVGTLGYGKITTLWLTAPAWFATFLLSVCVTLSSAKTNDRSLHIICLMLVAAIGNAIAAATTVVGARFFAMFLMPMGSVASYQIIVSWVANSFPRPLVKRSAVIAICNMIGNTASIYGSYMYPSKDGPQYTPGGSANAAICVIVALLALLLRYVHKWENKKLDKAEAEANAVATEDGKIDMAAATGTQRSGFRYIY